MISQKGSMKALWLPSHSLGSISHSVYNQCGRNPERCGISPSLVIALIFKCRLVVSPRSQVYVKVMGSFISEKRIK